MSKIIIENNTVYDIPIINIYQENAFNAPLVFFIHGYGGYREQALDYGYMLAQKGFYYVSMDCKGHGERKVINKDNRFSNAFPSVRGWIRMSTCMR